MRGIAVAVAVLAVPEYETAVAVKKSYHFSESRTAFPKVVGLFGENSCLMAVLAVLLFVLAVANSETAVHRKKTLTVF